MTAYLKVDLPVDKTKPTYTRSEFRYYKPTMNLIDDLCEGPERMWERSAQYIDKMQDEDVEVWRSRRLSAPCFGGVSRTIKAGVGLLLANEPSTNWNKKEVVMKPLWDNLDGKGTKGSVLLARFSQRALKHGFALWLIDHPTAPKTPDGKLRLVTAKEEQELNLRPTWAIYGREQVINWFTKTVIINNREELSRLVLAESGTAEDGDYGVKTVNRFRVLKLLFMADGTPIATWRLLEEQVVGTTVIYQQIGAGVYQNFDGDIAQRFPIAVGYTDAQKQPLVCDIPLAAQAYANLAHWQYSTDLKFGRRISAVEQMVITGEVYRDPKRPVKTDGGLEFGWLVAIHLEQGGTMEWKGPSGKGLEQLKMGAEESMAQMDQMGLGFLIPHKQVQTTATESRITSYAQLATLATAGKGIQDATNEGWEITGWYMGIAKVDCPVMTINTEFESTKMEAQVMAQYIALVTAGFPKMPVLKQLQDGGRIGPDEDLKKIMRDWEIGLAAAKKAALDSAARGEGEDDDGPPDGDNDQSEEDVEADKAKPEVGALPVAA